MTNNFSNSKQRYAEKLRAAWRKPFSITTQALYFNNFEKMSHSSPLHSILFKNTICFTNPFSATCYYTIVCKWEREREKMKKKKIETTTTTTMATLVNVLMTQLTCFPQFNGSREELERRYFLAREWIKSKMKKKS